MARYSAKSVLSLWDRLAELEHTTPHELAVRIGIGPSTITGWRKGRATTAHPSVFGLIELKLGYRCTLRPNGTWAIDKIGAPILRESPIPYDQSDLNGTFKGVSPTKIPALIVILKTFEGFTVEQLNRLAAEIRHSSPHKLGTILGIMSTLLQLDQKMSDGVATLVNSATLPQGDPLESQR